MASTLILHPGTEKSGGTSLLGAQYQKRETLQKDGILIPAVFGKIYHDLLFSTLQDDVVFDDIKRKILANSKWWLNERREQIRKTFEEDLKNNPTTTKLGFSVGRKLHIKSAVIRRCKRQLQIKTVFPDQDFADDPVFYEPKWTCVRNSISRLFSVDSRHFPFCKTGRNISHVALAGVKRQNEFHR